MEYALKRTAPGSFEEVTRAVERAIDAHGLTVVGAHDVHVTLAAKGFRIHPVRIYELRDTGPLPERSPRGAPALSASIVPARINVFVEGSHVVVAAVRPGVISEMFPEAGLDDIAARIESRLVDIVNEVAEHAS